MRIEPGEGEAGQDRGPAAAGRVRPARAERLTSAPRREQAARAIPDQEGRPEPAHRGLEPRDRRGQGAEPCDPQQDQQRVGQGADQADREDMRPEQPLPQHQPPSQQQQSSEALAQRHALDLTAAAQRRRLAVMQQRRVYCAEVSLGRLVTVGAGVGVKGRVEKG